MRLYASVLGKNLNVFFYYFVSFFNSQQNFRIYYFHHFNIRLEILCRCCNIFLYWILLVYKFTKSMFETVFFYLQEFIFDILVQIHCSKFYSTLIILENCSFSFFYLIIVLSFVVYHFFLFKISISECFSHCIMIIFTSNFYKFCP